MWMASRPLLLRECPSALAAAYDGVKPVRLTCCTVRAVRAICGVSYLSKSDPAPPTFPFDLLEFGRGRLKLLTVATNRRLVRRHFTSQPLLAFDQRGRVHRAFTADRRSGR